MSQEKKEPETENWREELAGLMNGGGFRLKSTGKLTQLPPAQTVRWTLCVLDR